MIELLQLPELTFPVAGLCLGYERGKSHIKPRMLIASFRHNEVYNADGLQQAIKAYDETLMAYWQKTGRVNGSFDMVALDHHEMPALQFFLHQEMRHMSPGHALHDDLLFGVLIADRDADASSSTK